MRRLIMKWLGNEDDAACCDSFIPKSEWKSNEKLTPALIRAIFDEIDEDQKGWLTEKDIEIYLTKFRLPNASFQANLLFKTLNSHPQKSTGITLTEFHDFVRRREETLLQIYSKVDANQDGIITPDELGKNLSMHSEIFSDPAIAKTASRALISRISVGGNDSCSFREFSRVFILMPEVDVELVFNHWAKYSHTSGEDYSLPDDSPVEKSRLNIFLSGAAAGCVSRTTTAPLDRLKVIMQAGKGDATIINMCRYMYNEGGLLGFWRGNGINCLKIAPESAAKFLCYDEFKKIITSITGGDVMSPSIGEKFVAGASAGAVSQALVYPLEITKTRLALSTTGEYDSIFSVISQIMKDNNGTRGLYRGLIPSVLGIVPYAGIDLMVFFSLKERWVAQNKTSQRTPGVLTLLLFGATSTTVGQVVAYPLQLVRTRLQADKGGELRKYQGMLDCLKISYQQGGFWGLYRGIGPNLLKSIPSISISYAVFETCSNYLHGMVI